MKFFTARTLPIFEQCFGQNKKFFNSRLAEADARSYDYNRFLSFHATVKAIRAEVLQASSGTFVN